MVWYFEFAGARDRLGHLKPRSGDEHERTACSGELVTVALADIKKDLPTWPDDVIEQWLLYLADRKDTGWPPPDPLGDHPWTHILSDKPVAWWSMVQWKLQKIDCSLAKLSKDTKARVLEIYDVAVSKSKKDEYNLIRRHNESLFYLLHNGTFPKPIIATAVASGLNVLDGSHRVTGLYSAQQMTAVQLANLRVKRPPVTQEIWVGTHSGGEVLVG
jgi:hypothetical protein